MNTLQNNIDSTVQSLKHNLTDPLVRFSNLSEVLQRDDASKYVLYLTEVNKKKIGVVAITDSVLFLFQQVNNKWVQTDSLTFDTYAFSFDITELNGDDNKDFIVYGFGNMHGQSIPYIFLSDKQSVLHYRSDIRLYNIKYDPNKKLVKSSYHGGAYGINYKEYYFWQNDSLKLFKGVKQNLSNPKKTTITYYNFKNGKRNDYKILIDNSGAIYDTALWKGVD